jgi:hypothetical protein
MGGKAAVGDVVCDGIGDVIEQGSLFLKGVSSVECT